MKKINLYILEKLKKINSKTISSISESYKCYEFINYISNNYEFKAFDIDVLERFISHPINYEYQLINIDDDKFEDINKSILDMFNEGIKALNHNVLDNYIDFLERTTKARYYRGFSQEPFEPKILIGNTYYISNNKLTIISAFDLYNKIYEIFNVVIK